MKILILCFILLSFVSCGFTERGTKGVVQIKRIHHVTPLICSERIVLDASLGVMQNGVGSMSTQDIDITVSIEQSKILERAVESGKLVEIKYSTRRFDFCNRYRILEEVKIMDDKVDNSKGNEIQDKPQVDIYKKCVELAVNVKELEICQTMK
jgi:hypothetical protein